MNECFFVAPKYPPLKQGFTSEHFVSVIKGANFEGGK